ncbi:glycosyltransferase family 25 protein [Halopseudomonas aestusnigri]|uniref:glycosyltransferase family 25 protein n=1 Tax=Halopseudomonas aestusnigri TaxID=857252 RepID=UPI0030032B15
MKNSTGSLLIQVISLEDDYKRRYDLKKMFVQEANDFRFVDAIDLRSNMGEQSILYDKSIKPPVPNLSAVEYGCMLSHVKALSQFIDSDYDFCLVLEDDVVGDDSSIAYIKNFVTCGAPRKVFALCGGQDGLKNTRYVRGYHLSCGWFRLSGISKIFLARTCCYLVDRDMAKTLIDKYRASVCRADDWLYLLKGCKNIYYRNLLSHPTDLSRSHIEASRKKLNRGFWFVLANEGLVKLYVRSAMKLCSIFLGFIERGERCTDLKRFPYPFHKSRNELSEKVH